MTGTSPPTESTSGGATGPQAGIIVVLLLLGLMAGFFYAFSVCVMPGLDLTRSDIAIRAMQGINTAVRNPVFFVTFFLTPVFALATALFLYRTGRRRPALWMVLAGVGYLVLCLFPTAAMNVPMNRALDLVDAGQLAAERATTVWLDYARAWTGWNHFRTAGAVLAMIPAALALRAVRQTGPGVL